MSFISNGDIWSAFLANQSLTNVPDGNTEIPGHSPKIIDDFLSDNSDQIKARFYNWFNNLRVTLLSGVTVSVASGTVILATGEPFFIADSTLILADNNTFYIFVDSNGAVGFSTSIPVSCVTLARVTVSSGSITSITDLRPPLGYPINTFGIPSQIGTFRAGDIKYTLRETVDPGWLLCPPVDTFVDPVIFTDLFNAIGYKFGQSGNLFKLPLGNVYLSGLSSGSISGSIVGDNNRLLTADNLPRHSHSVLQTPHNHSVNDTGHSHGNINGSHGHNVSQQAHNHGVNDPGHDHTANTYRRCIFNNVRDFDGAEISAAPQVANQAIAILRSNTNISLNPSLANIQVQNAALNLSVPSARADINVNPANSNINVEATGNSQAFDNRPRTMMANLWIKA